MTDNLPQYSTNPQVQQTSAELLALGCPPIPVAPKQLALNDPKITGKNPSYLDPRGIVKFCKHGEFQNRLPTEEELIRFFCNPNTGIGTLGGHGGIAWLDFDRKCYPSQEACDADFNRIVNKVCIHALCHRKDLWIEQTGSGGYRLAVTTREIPGFTNFTTSPDGQHVGEALFEGRFTVLAPSLHPNGNYYQRLEWGRPVSIESLEAIGIYPATVENGKGKKKGKKGKKKENKKAPPQTPDTSDPTIAALIAMLISTVAVPFELLLTRSDAPASPLR